MSDWQKMHSAPTDGTLVDLWVRGEKKDLIPLTARFHRVGALYEGRAADCFMGGDQQWWHVRGGFAALIGGTPIAWRERLPRRRGWQPMIELCRNCGSERLNQFGGQPDRKCRRCGEYWPAPGSVIGPELDTQFRGTAPYGKGIPLADIIAKINGEWYERD